MTKEEIIKHLHKALNFVDITFPYRYVFVEAIEALSQSSLPSNLDEAAQKVEDYYDVGEEHGYLYCHRGDIKDVFKAGAEWMAGQGVSVDGKVIMNFSEPYDIINRRLIAKLGDALLEVEPGEVIVQIRKKQ